MKKLLNVFAVLLISVMLIGCNDGNDEANMRGFDISVYDADDALIASAQIATEEETLFDALVASDEFEIGYEESTFGVFITTINGVEAGPGYFWAFYINSEMAMVGADGHTVEDGDQFEFRLDNY